MKNNIRNLQAHDVALIARQKAVRLEQATVWMVLLCGFSFALSLVAFVRTLH